ncbi:hypothetical protein ACPRNU_25460, partial [Chromobacterium vaccinii]|uniref:hypothetical protein n=1 Tax=Chromobacterium vaccinii TaxID=1108595 RepID=UPI003C74836E
FCQSGIWRKQSPQIGGQYQLRRFYRGGGIISSVGNPMNSWLTSCPSGFLDVTYWTGQSYQYSEWDAYYEMHFCTLSN